MKTKPKEIKEWKPWFAWRPVTIYSYDPLSEQTVWLEWIEQRFIVPEFAIWHGDCYYDYRLPSK